MGQDSRFQFSLRSLFVGITLYAICLSLLFTLGVESLAAFLVAIVIAVPICWILMAILRNLFSVESWLQLFLRGVLVVTTLWAMFLAVLYTFSSEPLAAFLMALLFTLPVSWVLMEIFRSIFAAAAADPKSPQSIATVPSDVHAAPIVEALRGAGIAATAVGGYTAGFRAEAPGQVHVVVAREDADRARQVLAEVRAGEASGEKS